MSDPSKSLPTLQAAVAFLLLEGQKATLKNYPPLPTDAGDITRMCLSDEDLQRIARLGDFLLEIKASPAPEPEVTPLTGLEREELEIYRLKSENGQIAAYYLLAEELGVAPGGSVVDTVHARLRAAQAARPALLAHAITWWTAIRPQGWTVTRHAETPGAGTKTMAENALAQAVVDYLRGGA